MLCSLKLKDFFLSPGLVPHGYNDFISNKFVVAPYENVSSGSKGTCNFYQSQVRILVEKYFGMLVRR